MFLKYSSKRAGFTLLEVLLVVATITIMAGIVILAVNPTKQLGEARDAQRTADVNTILNAVYQEAIDSNGTVNSNIPTSSTCDTTATNEVCRTGGTCTSLVDISSLVTNQTYLVSIPEDPTGTTTNGAGYHIAKSTNNRITVCAPDTEQSATTISVTR